MKLLQAQPELKVTALRRALDYYTEVLGFEVSYHVEEVHAVLKRDGVYLHLDPLGTFHPCSCQILVDDVEGLYAQVRDRTRLVHELHDPPWGGRCFVVLDPDGNSICFACWS